MYEILSMSSTAKDINNLTYTDYFYRLMLMARSVFKWEGLPNGIDEKWIEKYLFAEGQCMFFHDEKLGFMVAKTAMNGQLNYYDEPTNIMPYATNHNFENRTYHNFMGRKGAGEFPEAVLIRNNDMMLPTAPTIRLYALRLTDIARTIDVNINAQKTPSFIKCSEKQRLTLKNVFRQWTGNEPVIFGDKDMSDTPIQSISTEAPIVFDKLQIQKHAIWNEAMTFLGINNANMDKRERLVDDEVQANNEQIELSASVMLKSREKACELINKLFPECNVSVSLRNREEMEQMYQEEKKGELANVC